MLPPLTYIIAINSGGMAFGGKGTMITFILAPCLVEHNMLKHKQGLDFSYLPTDFTDTPSLQFEYFFPLFILYMERK